MAKRQGSIIKMFIAILLMVFTAIILYLYFNQFSVSLSLNQSDWAGFGSYIGGTLGAFFAFASFWILFYTFSSQQKQAKNNEIQKFETTFYSLLELHNQSLRELESKISNDKLDALFDNSLRAWDASDEEIMSASDHTVFTPKEEGVSNPDCYLECLQRFILKEVELSQYFRVLYQLLKFVAKNNVHNTDYKFDTDYLDRRNNISEEYEKMYASLIRGFVPVRLLPVLALNCIPTDKGLHNLEKYRSLLEKYNFLEHIRLDLIPDNLATFLVLDRYSEALGKNREIEDKVVKIKAKYERFLDEDTMKNGYLYKNYQLELNSLEYSLKELFLKKMNEHFEKVSFDFYDEEKTIHEPIMFFISSISTMIFFTTIVGYSSFNYKALSDKIPWVGALILPVLLVIFAVIVIYVSTMSFYRIAATLGRKNINDNWAIILIILMLSILAFGIFISSLL